MFELKASEHDTDYFLLSMFKAREDLVQNVSIHYIRGMKKISKTNLKKLTDEIKYDPQDSRVGTSISFCERRDDSAPYTAIGTFELLVQEIASSYLCKRYVGTVPKRLVLYTH